MHEFCFCKAGRNSSDQLSNALQSQLPNFLANKPDVLSWKIFIQYLLLLSVEYILAGWCFLQDKCKRCICCGWHCNISIKDVWWQTASGTCGPRSKVCHACCSGTCPPHFLLFFWVHEVRCTLNPIEPAKKVSGEWHETQTTFSWSSYICQETSVVIDFGSAIQSSLRSRCFQEVN